MANQPSWNECDPPKDRQVLALAFAKAFRSGSVNLVRVVAAWVESHQEWRPVIVVGDTSAEIDLDVICWAELPAIPETVGRLKKANRPTQVYPRPKSG
jgi:cytochrome P450